MAIFLKSYGAKNYRSLGGEGIELQNLGSINVLIGPNNAGKSNILRVLKIYGSYFVGNHQTLPITDHFGNDNRNRMVFTLAVNNLDEYYSPLGQKRYASYAIGADALALEGSFVSEANPETLRQFCNEKYHTSTSDHGPNVNMTQNRDEFRRLFTPPPVVLVDEYRSRENIVTIKDKLQRLWNHGAKNTHMRPIKEALIEFIRVALLSDFDLHFDPDDSSQFSIAYKNGDVVDFESLGSGIKQIFFLGLAIANTRDSIVLIDEPELSLHPKLLRKLLHLIFSNDTNQYFLATHSNVLLDALYDRKLYLVDKAEVTKVVECTEAENIRTALDIIGVKASDLLQANGIIWVEGPSDRQFILRWLELTGCKLLEGTDYAFQYYGGKLLAHLTVDDDLEEFVNLLDINRNAYIVMDSDFGGPGDWTVADLAPRKQRVIDECEKKGIKVWVTFGREIENYIPNEVWTSFSGKNTRLERYDDSSKVIEKYANKPLNARELCKSFNSDQVVESGDLLARLKELNKELQAWNA